MKIEHFTWDDWDEVYVDGELFAQGHSIRDGDWHDLLSRLGADVSDKWVGDAGDAEFLCGDLDALRSV